MNINIRPLDTLFFRDGKPFSMGEESWADGIFPPSPSVLYGAVRTWYITNKGQEINQHIIDESGEIKINNVFYEHSGQLYFPLPLDMVQPKVKTNEEKFREKEEKEYRAIKLTRHVPSNLSNYPLSTLLMPTKDVGEVGAFENALISIDNFKQYLEGTLLEYKRVKKISDLALSEPKVGIGRNKHTASAENGKLYRVGIRRPNEFEFRLQLTLPTTDFKYNQFLKLGGEGKVAILHEKSRIPRNSHMDNHQIDLKGKKQFKLYLATPALFKDGWYPNLDRFGLNAQLIAAAVGKPMYIGGFDMAKRRSKPMLKAVPAGSVYYFQSSEPSEKTIEKLQGKAISDFLPEQGFGIAYIGNY